jgi:RNA polymerase sigma-70 factor (ECF subfamily)
MKNSTPSPAIGDRWLQWYQAARTGDRDAETRLLLEVRPFLRAEVERFAQGQAFGAWDGSDVVQDFFVKLQLLQPGQDFRGTTSQQFLKWLRTMVYRKFLDILRAAQADKRGGGQPLGPLPGDSHGDVALAADTSTPSEQLIRREEQEEVAVVLERLSADYQQVIRLRIFDGSSWAEIATAMDRSVDAVKKLYERAIDQSSVERGQP